MNILAIIPYVPDKIRSRPLNLLINLQKAGHRLVVLAPFTSQFEQPSVDQLTALGVTVETFPLPKWRSYLNCLAALLTKEPLQAAYCWQPDLAARALELWESGAFDAIHVEHLRGVKYALALIGQSESARMRLAWDSVDNITYLFQQAVPWDRNPVTRLLRIMELNRTRTYENRLPAKFRFTLVTSKIDKMAFTGPDNENTERIQVLPNGVDLAYFTPASGDREPATLIVSGKMSYHANARMVGYLVGLVMPLVWATEPNVKLWVVGKDPSQEIIDYGKDPRILVTGTVEDIRPYLQRATIAVAPLVYGAGIQNKVLEAMACATPVICSPKAIAALEVEPERDVVVAESPAEFAKQILRLLNDPALCNEIGRTGRKYVEMHHDWSKIAGQFVAIYERMK